MVDGFINLNKPASFTSHDCVAKVRRALRVKRVGHAGTLDPAATGVLPIAFGRATRLLQFLRQDKAYRATIKFGLSTTTDDLEGEALLTQPAPQLQLQEIETALPAFQGVIQQIPPNFSAIQVQGKRLYDLARAGSAITVQPRQVEVYQLEVLDWRSGEFPELDLRIACGPGTYIRAIARDLGQVLQTGGTLAALTRISSSGFDLEDSLALDTLEAEIQNATFQPVLPDVALEHLPKLVLPPDSAKRWCQGQKISAQVLADLPAVNVLSEASAAPTTSTATALRVYHVNGCFLGIGQWSDLASDTLLVPQVVLEPAL